jgi:hypothetical protein
MKTVRSLAFFTTFLFCSGSSPEKSTSALRSILKKKDSLSKGLPVHFASGAHVSFKNLPREERTPLETHKHRLRQRALHQKIEREERTHIFRSSLANEEWKISSPASLQPPLDPLRDIQEREKKLSALTGIGEAAEEDPTLHLTKEEKETHQCTVENADRTVSFIKIAEMRPEQLKKEIETLVYNLLEQEKEEMELFAKFTVKELIEEKLIDSSWAKGTFDDHIDILNEARVFGPTAFQNRVRNYLEAHDYDFPPLTTAHTSTPLECTDQD